MFITFEGIDGSGKTLQLNKLYAYLLNNQIKVHKTSESKFSQSRWEREIFSVIINENLDLESQIKLINVVRFEHLKIVKSYLDSGFIVLCDRFFHSTCAYQGFLKNNSFDDIVDTHNRDFDSFHPDLTFFIDADPSVASQRMKNRQVLSAFDKFEISMVQKIRECYDLCSERFDYFKRIDGNNNPDIVFDELKKVFLKFYK